jgi:peptide-methionine (R)-S-oxide reductase
MEYETKDWKKKLSKEQYNVLRQRGTEPAFSSNLLKNDKTGIYMCVACGNPLFSSKTKFDSGTGWPSFYDALPGAVKLKKDLDWGAVRTEIICSKCGSHLGHMFSDAPQTITGKRYCLNGCALDFKGKGKDKEK